MSKTEFLRQLALDRRSFLGGMAAGAAGAALPAIDALRQPDTPADMAAALRLAGLEFSDAEIRQITGRIGRMRSGFTELRQHTLGFETAPAWVFDPLPTGANPPALDAKAPAFAPSPNAAQLSIEDADLAYASIPDLAALLQSRRVSSRRLTTLALSRLKQHNASLHCVVTLLEQGALAAADRADEEIAAGRWRGPLHGIPYGAKDLFAWPDAPTTFGAAPYKTQVWKLKATVLRRLEERGAILVAKLSLGALAMGDHWFGGQTRNPWNPRQGSSGSSAGPAAAASAGLVPFTIGTETLGSIVSPCTRCGVAGLRPSFGTVSRHGAMPLSWSMDKVGPIARHAIDLAIVYDAIRGPDGHDRMIRAHRFTWPSTVKLTGLRVGLVHGRRNDLAESELVQWLARQGAEIKPLVLPDFPYDALRNILSVEAATAFDDLTRSDDIDQLTRQTTNSWPNTFRAARFVPAVEFLRATRLRSKLIDEMHETMQGVDIYVAARGGNSSLYCSNLTGHPSVVLPTAKSRRGPQPDSLTMVGQLYGESTLLQVASQWQQATRWHLGRPLV